jgi:uncharacterized damage-inducible protein DinB
MSHTKDRLAIQPLAGYASPVGYAIGCLEEERQRSREAVEGLTVKELDTQVEAFANSIGSLLYHIALIELDWLYCEVLEQEIPERFRAVFPHDVRDENGKLSVVTGISLAAHLERLELVRQTLRDELIDLTRDDFYRLRSFEAYEVNPAWVLYHLLEHEAKHGEQVKHIRRLIASG